MAGHIRKRGSGSWTVVVDLGRDPVTGKRRQTWRTVRGTKRDAEALLVSLLHERDTGIDIQPGRVAAGQYLRRWLEAYAQPNTAPKTFRRYEELIRLHLLPSIGSIELGKLRPAHIQHVYGRLQEKGLSPRTVLQCHRVLREALQHAVRWQLLSRNPADAVEAPRYSRYEVPALVPDDLRRLLDEADKSRFGAIVRLAVMTGLRQGELLGLRWQDVDLQAGALRVRQACQWLPRQGFIFRPPKSHRSVRPVALSPAAVARLREHRSSQLEERLVAGPAYEDMGLVFATAVGRPLHPSVLRKAWLKMVEKSGLGRLRFHDLRHAHATLMLQQGVHPKIVSERLGHSGVSITLDTYSHVLPGLQAQAAAQLDLLIEGGRQRDG
jgi:integrase